MFEGGDFQPMSKAEKSPTCRGHNRRLGWGTDRSFKFELLVFDRDAHATRFLWYGDQTVW